MKEIRVLSTIVKFAAGFVVLGVVIGIALTAPVIGALLSGNPGGS